MNPIIDYIQLNEDDSPEQITKPAKITKHYVNDRTVKELRSQVMVDNLESVDAKYFDDMIKDRLIAGMMQEIVRRIKIEKMPNGFTEYGSTMYTGKISIVE